MGILGEIPKAYNSFKSSKLASTVVGRTKMMGASAAQSAFNAGERYGSSGVLGKINSFMGTTIPVGQMDIAERIKLQQMGVNLGMDSAAAQGMAEDIVEDGSVSFTGTQRLLHRYTGIGAGKDGGPKSWNYGRMGKDAAIGAGVLGVGAIGTGLAINRMTDDD